MSLSLGGPGQTSQLGFALFISTLLHGLILASPTGQSGSLGVPLYTMPTPYLAKKNQALEVRFSQIHPLPDPAPTASQPAIEIRSGILSDLPPSPLLPDAPVKLDAEYLKSSQLTTPPSVITLGSLDSKAPDTEGKSGRLVFEILINENGRAALVQPIVVDAPEHYRAYATAVFLDAHYRPGEILGKPVKSRIKIEVTIQDGVIAN